MQEYSCPRCGHVSTFDPWIESARCPQCGHTPQEGTALRGRLSKKATRSHQPYLDELLAHWEGRSIPDKTFTVETAELAMLFFQDYQRAMGEDPYLGAGSHARYVRNYHPDRTEIVGFVGAYLLLRRGQREQAGRRLRDLTLLKSEFADPWIWCTASTDDPTERREFLENALLNEPAHPLARDAMAILRGTLPAGAPHRAEGSLPRLIAIRCQQCGGELHYKAGTDEVTCPHCGQEIPLQRAEILEEDAPLLGDLQMKRR